MKASTPIKKHHGRYLLWAVGSAAFLGLAGTLWALSEVLENDSDGDGWTDAEEIVAETNPADETDPSWFGIPKCRKREATEGNIMRNLF